MSYTMPDGDDVGFVFSQSYEKPYGDSSGNFVVNDCSHVFLEFTFEDSYVKPAANNIIFWFNETIGKEFKLLTININVSIKYEIVSSISSNLNINLGQQNATLECIEGSFNANLNSDFDSKFEIFNVGTDETNSFYSNLNISSNFEFSNDFKVIIFKERCVKWVDYYKNQVIDTSGFDDSFSGYGLIYNNGRFLILNNRKSDLNYGNSRKVTYKFDTTEGNESDLLFNFDRLRKIGDSSSDNIFYNTNYDPFGNSYVYGNSVKFTTYDNLPLNPLSLTTLTNESDYQNTWDIRGQLYYLNTGSGYTTSGNAILTTVNNGIIYYIIDDYYSGWRQNDILELDNGRKTFAINSSSSLTNFYFISNPSQKKLYALKGDYSNDGYLETTLPSTLNSGINVDRIGDAVVITNDKVIVSVINSINYEENIYGNYDGYYKLYLVVFDLDFQFIDNPILDKFNIIEEKTIYIDRINFENIDDIYKYFHFHKLSSNYNFTKLCYSIGNPNYLYYADLEEVDPYIEDECYELYKDGTILSITSNLDFSSMSIERIDFQKSLLNINSNLDFNKDEERDIESNISISSNLYFDFDDKINLNKSEINLTLNISVSFSANIQSNSSIVSEFNYIKKIYNDFIFAGSIGKLYKEFELVNGLNDIIKNNFIVKNGFNINRDFVFYNSINLSSDFNLKNDIRSLIINNFDFNVNLLNNIENDFQINNSFYLINDFTFNNNVNGVIKNDFEFNNTINYIIIKDFAFNNNISNVIINYFILSNSFKLINDFNFKTNINQDVINDFNFNNNSLNIVQNDDIFNNSINLINDFIYFNEIKFDLISDFVFNNNFRNIIINDFDLKNNILLKNDFIIKNDIKQNIIKNFEFNNNLLNIIEKDFISLLSFSLNNSFNYINNINQDIANDFILNNNLLNIIEKDIIIKNSLIIGNDFNYINDINQDVINDFDLSYDLSDDIKNNFIFNNGFAIKSDFDIKTNIGLGIISEINISNDLMEKIENDIIYKNKLNERNDLYNDFKFANYIEDDNPIIYSPSVVIEINDNSIEFNSFNISIDDDSYCYSLSASLNSIEDWSLCKIGEIIKITLNGVYYEFIIDERTRNREFNSVSYDITGRSKSSILGQGYFNNISKSWPSSFISQIVNEIMINNDIEYEFNLDDWSIPENIFNADNSTPISILQDIIDASGGIIVCDPVGKLYINKKYNKSPILWDSSSKQFNDYENIFSVSELKEITPKWNAVIISNSEESIDYSYSISEITDEATEEVRKIRVFVYPFLNNLDLFTSYISQNVKINKENNPIIEEINDEIVEIIEGEGTSDKLIKSIESYEYLNNNLGTIQFDGNKIVTQINGQSLIKLSYKTEYHEFTLINQTESDYIQVYTTDESEVL